MIYLITFVLLVWVWVIIEWINAPFDNTKQKDDDSAAKPNDTHNKGV